MKPNSLLFELRASIVSTIAFVVVLCGIYPLVVWAIVQAVFPDQANGSLIRNSHGDIVGSSLLAQAFDDSIYFHPRPSAAGNGYDAANSSGSNLGSTSQKLMDQLKARAEVFRRDNDLSPDAKLPADAITASSSGLDPHISPANAMLQASRVARARGLSQQHVEELIRRNTQGRFLGILGESGVNVLQLNLALDKRE
jgi:K+-transporting ATPase ATPase C chain